MTADERSERRDLQQKQMSNRPMTNTEFQRLRELNEKMFEDEIQNP